MRSQIPLSSPRIPEAARKRMGAQPPAIRYCLYARKSSESEERQALSIDSQINEMKKIAERDDLTVVDVRRESHSAKDRGMRPVFNEIIKDIRIGKFTGILTWAPDRLSRNAGDLGIIVDLMDQRKLLEIRTYGQTFADSPNDKFLLMILGSQAKLENDNRSVNVKRGMRSRVEMGLWPDVAPLGYLNQYRTDKRCEVILDEQRAPIIKQMFQKVANDHWSMRKVYQWLDQEIHFRTKGDNVLTFSGIQRMLNNPFYYGKFEYPRGSGKWYNGKHVPIVTKQLFEKAKKHLQRDQIVRRNKEFSFVRLFSCGLCGSGIGAEEKLKPLKDGTIAKYCYYGCTRGRDRFCKNQYIREDVLIEQLITIFDNADIDELGVRQKFEQEAVRFGKFRKFLRGQPTELSIDEVNLNLKVYVVYVLRDGSISEKRELLGHLRSRLQFKNRQIALLDPVNQ